MTYQFNPEEDPKTLIRMAAAVLPVVKADINYGPTSAEVSLVVARQTIAFTNQTPFLNEEGFMDADSLEEIHKKMVQTGVQLKIQLHAEAVQAHGPRALLTQVDVLVRTFARLQLGEISKRMEGHA